MVRLNVNAAMDDGAGTNTISAISVNGTSLSADTSGANTFYFIISAAGETADATSTGTDAADAGLAKISMYGLSSLKVDVSGKTAASGVPSYATAFTEWGGAGWFGVTFDFGNTEEGLLVNPTEENFAYDGDVLNISVEYADLPAAPVAPADAPAAAGDTSAAASSDKGSAETGVEGVAVVAGFAIIAAGAVIVTRKRK